MGTAAIGGLQRRAVGLSRRIPAGCRRGRADRHDTVAGGSVVAAARPLHREDHQHQFPVQQRRRGRGRSKGVHGVHSGSTGIQQQGTRPVFQAHHRADRRRKCVRPLSPLT